MEGVGHYEPLRHYAEVHLKLEPLPRGSGMQFAADCREEVLDKNWQRLVLTHLEEKQHLGVLIGAPLTDVKITLIAGRAHLKHTEGGDFRQATYRAVRQGLMLAKSQLLEPWYAFRLELPSDNVGRAMNDIQNMGGSFDPPETGADGDTTLLTGTAPASTMRSYPMEVVGYTRGRGHLTLTLDGYRPCHNAAEVIAAAGYEPEHDLDNPADSVFCSHGAGFVVPWEQVRSHMHVDSGWGHTAPTAEESAARPRRMAAYRATLEEDAELLKIFERTYGPIKRDPLAAFRPVQKRERPDFAAEQWEIAPEYLLVDGYNIILKKPINIGIAVSLNDGNLIVPVIHDADKLNLSGLASQIDTLAAKARENKLAPDSIQGGTFTITNFGTFKSLFGTPIINQPQVAILAVGYIEKKPAVVETPEGDTIAIRHKMYLSLSYDHRIVDGALAGAFLRSIADELENCCLLYTSDAADD